MIFLSPSIVLVNAINSPVPIETFPLEKLEQAAKSFLKLGGCIAPLILRRTGYTESGFPTYLVVDGHFQLHAARIARDMDSIEGKTINAYIIDDLDEEALKEQISMFRKELL